MPRLNAGLASPRLSSSSTSLLVPEELLRISGRGNFRDRMPFLSLSDPANRDKVLTENGNSYGVQKRRASVNANLDT